MLEKDNIMYLELLPYHFNTYIIYIGNGFKIEMISSCGLILARLIGAGNSILLKFGS